MRMDFRSAGLAARLAALAMLPVMPAFAADLLDEDSLFAQEDLALSEAVAGGLPDAAVSNDFLNELFAGGDFDLPGEPDEPESLPLADLFAEEPAPVEEPLPASLDGLVDGVAAEPAPEIDTFPLDAGFDADAVLTEMMGMGDLEAADELDVAGAEDIPGGVAAEPADFGADLDAMLGEMTAEEPAEGAEPVDAGADLDAMLGEMTAEEPAEGAEPVDAGADLDAMLGEMITEDPAGEAAPAAEPDWAFDQEPVAEPVAATVEDKGMPDLSEDITDLDALIGELSLEAEADLGGELTAVDEEPEMQPVAVVPAIPAVEDEVDPVDVEIADVPPPVEDSDPMALDDDIFKDLAKETRVEMRATPAGIQASEVPVDPFAGLPGGLDGEASGVRSHAPQLPVSAPAAASAAVSAPGGEPLDADLIARESRPEGLSAFEEAERLKRTAREFHARNTLISAEKALREKDFARAIRLYEEGRRQMPRRADTEPLLAEARKGLAGAYYLQALSLERMEDWENAKIAAQNAGRNGYPKAEETVARIQRRIDAPPPPPKPSVSVRWQEDEYKDVQAQIRSYLKRGREAYLTGEYDRAIMAFESVLARDPENKEAIRLMRSAANKQYDRSSMELDATATRMMAAVRDTWNPRQYGLHETPIRDDGRMVTERQGEELQRMAILAKMGMIRIPEVDFRQANIRDVVNFLFQQSAEFDPDPVPANRKGVNIILKLDSDAPGAAPAPAAPLDPFAAFPAAAGPAAGGVSETLITFNARDITLKEALDIVVDIAGLKYLIRGNVVMVMPRDAAVGEIEHRMYDVLPSAITRLQELSSAVSGRPGGGRGGGDFLSLEPAAGGGAEDADLKGFFTEMGVQWPSRSSIKFVRGLGKLVVANTLENLTVFEKVLSVLNVVPYQIEIEARFIEVAQTDVDSLGLEWLLTDNWEIAQKKGSEALPLAQRPRIQMSANAGKGGFTAGNRFINTLGMGPGGIPVADEILRVGSVLTNPELGMVLHALQQKGATDLLSAPKITTQSGQKAMIRVVTEYIYPENYTIGTQGGGEGGAVAPPSVYPESWATTNVGVILEVTPEVSPEGQMINLVLEPRVISEPTWRDYGFTWKAATAASTSTAGVTTEGVELETHIPIEKPFFHVRSLSTSLLIYNGATVVMGGMITEVRKKVDDKVPLLGDIPLIGRLFRSQYESSEKRNLLIFVTARLVDPAGRALDRDRFTKDKSIAERLAIGGEPAAK